MTQKERISDIFEKYSVELAVEEKEETQEVALMATAVLESGQEIMTDADAFAVGVSAFVVNDEGERSDGDRVPDKRDECPNEPISPQADPARSNGCPARVIVTADAIEIMDKVYFNTGKASIKNVSYPLLDDVAAVLMNNLDLTLIEVAGHTDSQGSNKSNLDLSQRRAESVKAYLVSKGVDANRLSPKGYGENRPTGTNETAEGRADNRRVEFTIEERE